ncbi:MAG: hypothetical protein V1652_04405 [bacterium]
MENNHSDQLRKIREDSQKEMDRILENARRDEERRSQRFKDFDSKLHFARQISRDAITKIVLLAAGIVGFSVSLFSIPVIGTNLNLQYVRLSWYALVGVIALGYIILLLEGRIEHAVTWKNFQLSQYPEDHKYTFKQKFYASMLFLVTIVYPKNLFFNRPYSREPEKTFKETTNSLLVHYLARSRGFLDIIENLTIILFIAALILLILSFPFSQ